MENLGCWADKSSRAIATLEETHPALMDNYKNRIDPYDKCLKAALDFGEILGWFSFLTSHLSLIQESVKN